jgi:DNA gyrase subunit A
MALSGEDEVVGMVIIENGERDLLAISSRGYGKRSDIDDYRVQTRGGKGIITMKATQRTGNLVAIKGVLESDDLMISTVSGIMIRMHVADISTLGRNTQGVRLISLKGDDAIADVTRVVPDEDEDEPVEASDD